VHRQHNTLAVFVEQQTMVVALMIVFGLTGTGVLFTALSALGVVQAPDDEPGSLPGINGAAFGIGGSIGFAWSGPIVGTGTVSGFQTSPIRHITRSAKLADMNVKPIPDGYTRVCDRLTHASR